VFDAYDFFHTRADLLRSPRLGERVWSVFGSAMKEAIRAPAGEMNGVRRATLWFFERLPGVNDALLAIVSDPDEPEHARATAATLLGVRQVGQATLALSQALNEPLPWLHAAARWALDRIPAMQPARLEPRRLAIIPCSHRWNELMPMADRSRYCADCDAAVKPIGDLLSLPVVGEQTCGFFDLPKEHDIIVDGTRLRVGHRQDRGNFTVLNIGAGRLVIDGDFRDQPREVVVDVDAMTHEVFVHGTRFQRTGSRTVASTLPRAQEEPGDFFGDIIMDGWEDETPPEVIKASLTASATTSTTSTNAPAMRTTHTPNTSSRFVKPERPPQKLYDLADLEGQDVDLDALAMAAAALVDESVESE
jgi:hypothetical protein